ncbi:unnamed protein product [Acanthoscelides obtectus]|uniref:Larval cuticle protein LCP-30 n=1 Tax=Acanthoscelides obtectus TaxID=200917 RepID=A0A9P0L7Y6_ACAOB|nr:unnamed protein product [Acanthoscelides obtectus]CAK1677724.1 Larval cuticle protein LCP-30 [Acanthoscelides obtectus]
MKAAIVVCSFFLLLGVCQAKAFDVPYSRVVHPGEKIEKDNPYFRYVKEGDYIPDTEYVSAASSGSPVRYRQPIKGGGQEGQYVPGDEGKYRPEASQRNTVSSPRPYVHSNAGTYRPEASRTLSVSSPKPYVSSAGTYRPEVSPSSSIVTSPRPFVTSDSGAYKPESVSSTVRPASNPKRYAPNNQAFFTSNQIKYRPAASSITGNAVQYLAQGQYFPDDTGRYIHDDSGRYIPDYSGLWQDDGTGRYTHMDVPYKPEATVIRKQYLIPYGLFPGAKYGTFDDSRWRILRLINDQNKEGYHYDFETENEIFGAQDAVIQNKGTEDETINAQGYYKYTGPNNIIYEVEYTADENGFIPTAAHLHPALKRALEYQLKSKENNKK